MTLKFDDEIARAMGSIADAKDSLSSAYVRLELLQAPITLPAPALTEDAIVAAFKADPAMAGRVMVQLSLGMTVRERSKFATAAHAASCEFGNDYRSVLQSLAVALAAASYRG